MKRIHSEPVYFFPDTGVSKDTTQNAMTFKSHINLSQALCRYAKVNIVAKGDNNSIPEPSSWKLSEDATYVSYCDNETIQGVEFKSAPEVCTFIHSPSIDFAISI